MVSPSVGLSVGLSVVAMLYSKDKNQSFSHTKKPMSAYEVRVSYVPPRFCFDSPFPVFKDCAGYVFVVASN